MTALTSGALGQQIIDQVNRLRYLDSLEQVVYCDRWHEMPPASFDYHNQLDGYLAQLRHEAVTAPAVATLLAAAKEADLPRTGTVYEQGAFRFLQHEQAEANRVPAALQTASANMDATGQRLWQEVHEAGDLTRWLPFVQEQFDVKTRWAQAAEPGVPVYEALVHRFDPEYSLAELDALFAQLKPAVRQLIAENHGMAPAEADEILTVDATPTQVQILCDKAQAMMQMDPAKTVNYRQEHPVSVSVGPDDARPSTTLAHGALFAVDCLMHESGHSRYNYGANDLVKQAGLWGGIDGALHESQSLFYQRVVGLSKEWWQAFYPEVQAVLPKYRQIAFSDFYAAKLALHIGPNRLDADELSYVMHIAVRYETERAYFSGQASVAELPAIWNTKYHDYLGVTPASPAEGIMADVHWGSGHIGYFQSYVLGIAYAAQFYHALRRDDPEAFPALAGGDMTRINAWLREHVHQFGQLFPPRELLRRATGEDLNPQYLIDYLKERHG